MRRCWVFAFTLIISGCSLNGVLVLHNATSEPATFLLTSDSYDSHKYVIGSNNTGSIDFNFNIRNEVEAIIGGRQQCYNIRALPSGWINVGFFRSKIYAKLASSGKIFLYPKSSAGSDYFEKSPPTQPSGFPLTPTQCKP